MQALVVGEETTAAPGGGLFDRQRAERERPGCSRWPTAGIVAYCEHMGVSKDTLLSYLQVDRKQSRVAGPQDDDRAHLAGFARRPRGVLRAPALGTLHGRGRRQAEAAQQPEEDPQKLFTEACLHGLRAKLCDDVNSLDSYLPPQVAAMARKVADALEVPQPAAV
ncbi:hypothetical protein NRF20_00360 [Streptomyces sp. R-74717]|uniref:hypothetical protein n=1 Tax=Streptomyces TaxID=1883 RepID=UPI0037B29E0E